ncbi:MAG: hypothetical protein B6I20_12945 [Bacteroidetes bacterium 4572_117]|nr:MAG: hypothetical protein B6I20_12945 [Bacteroidetes bacterium 4572_117]
MNENEVLRQRIKELNGLISLMEIANKTEDLREVINKLTSNIIPKSMKFSDKVFSLVIIDNVENSNCKNISKKTSNYLKADIKTKKEKYGELQVGYIDENLKFIDEFEQKIVNAYAIALSKLIENLKYQEKIIKETHKLQKEKKLIAEMNYITKSGVKIPIEINTSLSVLNKKNIAITIVRDITERKIAERKLKAKNKELIIQ